MAAGGTRQRMTLSDQLSLLQPANLRDLLKVRDEDPVPRRSSSVTLAAVLASEKTSTSAADAAGGGGGGGSRTLLEVIREDEDEARVSGGSSSWRNLTDRLRIRHAAAAAATWAAGSPSSSNPTADGEVSDRVTTIRVSLMTLMEIRGREEEEATAGARATADDDVAAEKEVEEEEDDVAEVDKRHVCCVCMVRKKGAAFIPCGHTFCRVCSRELFLGRGNCPLCNGTISEVLDIF